MKKPFLITLVLAAMVLPTFSQTYEELCDRAATAIEHDSLPQAEHYIRQALKTDPANPRNALLFSNLGTVQRRQRHYDAALESYNYALNIAPRTPAILLNRAALYLETGKDEPARMDYALVLDLEPDNKEALEMRAFIYVRQRDYKSARADYEHLLKLSPQHFNGRLGLATLCQREGKYQDALSILNDMVNEKMEGTSLITAPLHAVVYTARADVEQELGHDDMALADLNEAIRLDNARVEAYLIRGQIYLKQENKEAAKRDFEKMVSLGVPRAELHELLTQCK